MFTFEVPFKHLLAPTSQSGMSNIFRDSESFSNGKKWSQIETFIVWKWFSITKQKKIVFFWADFALQNKVETTLPDGLENSGLETSGLWIRDLGANR